MSHSDSPALGHLFLCPGRVRVIVSETLPICGNHQKPPAPAGTSRSAHITSTAPVSLFILSLCFPFFISKSIALAA